MSDAAITPHDEKVAAATARLDQCLAGVTTSLPKMQGKVRDVLDLGDELLLVTTDRISAFDVVLGTVPEKGALLTEQAAFWLEHAATVIPTHLVAREDAQVLRVQKATPLPVEVVVRGYLAGSLLREPAETRGAAYGLSVGDVGAHRAFETPLITPTTKAARGAHDAPISAADIVASGRVTQSHWDAAARAALDLFALGQKVAAERGLLLVDTKYEFGLVGDQLVLIDELHTADSSRYWEAADYEDRLARGEAPRMLDKERLRRRLLADGYAGEGPPPSLSDEVRLDVSIHYWELTERLVGRRFVPPAEAAPARLSALLQRFA